MLNLMTFLRKFLVLGLFLLALPAGAKVKLSPLAEKLLYGDEPTRLQGVEEFNRMSAESQQRLVPDFMVAMSDDDPGTRKIASRILKAMGVKIETKMPDAKKEMSDEKSKDHTGDKWEDEKRLKEDVSKDKWSELKKMQSEENKNYSSMKEQLDQDKKAFLDAALLTADSRDHSSPQNSVMQALEDPDPWVRAQAARRLGSIRPAPVEAIPSLMNMLREKLPESRRAAAAALGSFGTLAEKAAPALTAALSDSDPATRQLAQDALKQIQMRQ